MMTQKEIAKELVRKFELRFDEFDDENYTSMVGKEEAKQCALICIDEIIKTKPRKFPTILIKNVLTKINDNGKTFCNKKYWQEIKQEIEKL